MNAVQSSITNKPFGEDGSPHRDAFPTRVDSGLGNLQRLHATQDEHAHIGQRMRAEQTNSLGNDFNTLGLTMNSNVNCQPVMDEIHFDRHPREQVHRRDSVATSSVSSSRKRRNYVSPSRRSSLHSGRPALSRGNSSYGTSPPHMSIQEAIDIHRRCVSLFQNPAVVTSTPSLPQSPYSAPSSPIYGNTRPTTGNHNTPGSLTPFSRSPPLVPKILDPLPGSEGLDEDHEPVPATVVHWTSSETRRREYAEIDRMHKGIRGLWQRFAPKWLCPRVRAKFYDEKNENDVSSVRRHRLDLETDDESEAVEKTKDRRPGVKRSVSCL